MASSDHDSRFFFAAGINGRHAGIPLNLGSRPGSFSAVTAARAEECRRNRLAARIRRFHKKARAGGRAPPPRAENAAVTVAIPSVTTVGKGPGGRKVDGLLYSYGRAPEEVVIWCYCHGTLMPPAEFVKHAGGNEVQYGNALKCIKINKGASLSF